MITERTKKLLPLLLILIAFYIRTIKLESPLLDVHSWRQTQTAMFARNFYKFGYKIFYPQVDWDGKNPGYYEIEFQLYTAIVALLYKFFGVKESIGRLISVLFSCGSIYFLFLLMSKYFDYKTSIFGIILFIISPLNIFFSRTFMPDATMLFFIISSIYFFSNYIDKPNILNFFLAFLTTTSAFLVKVPSVHILLPLFYLVYKKYNKKLFLQKDLYIFAILVLIPPIIWYTHSYLVGKESGLSAGIWTVGKDKWGNLDVWMSSNFYSTIFARIYYSILTPVIFPFFVIGLLLKVGNKEAYLFHFWLLSCIIYFYAASVGNIVHSYYQLPIIPVLCILSAKGLNILLDHNIVKLFFKKTLYVLIFLVFIISSLLSYKYINPAYNCNMVFYNSAMKVKELTKKDDLILVASWSLPEVLYYSERKGYHINPWESKPEVVDRFREKDVKYLVLVYPKFEHLFPEWVDFINRSKIVELKDNFLIIDLR